MKKGYSLKYQSTAVKLRRRENPTGSKLLGYARQIGALTKQGGEDVVPVLQKGREPRAVGVYELTSRGDDPWYLADTFEEVDEDPVLAEIERRSERYAGWEWTHF